MKMTPEVRRTVGGIAVGTAVLTAVMLVIYALLGRWSLSVLLGAAIGAICAVLNFYFMARSLQKAADRAAGEGQVKVRAQLGYMLRMLGMIGAAVLAIVVLKTDALATLLPYIFPSLAAKVLGARQKKTQGGERNE